MNQNLYLFDDEGASGGDDDVDEVEIAVAHFFDLQSIELVCKLGGESGRRLYVLYERLVVEGPESR